MDQLLCHLSGEIGQYLPSRAIISASRRFWTAYSPELDRRRIGRVQFSPSDWHQIERLERGQDAQIHHNNSELIAIAAAHRIGKSGTNVAVIYSGSYADAMASLFPGQTLEEAGMVLVDGADSIHLFKYEQWIGSDHYSTRTIDCRKSNLNFTLEGVSITPDVRFIGPNDKLWGGMRTSMTFRDAVHFILDIDRLRDTEYIVFVPNYNDSRQSILNEAWKIGKKIVIAETVRMGSRGRDHPNIMVYFSKHDAESELLRRAIHLVFPDKGIEEI